MVVALPVVVVGSTLFVGRHGIRATRKIERDVGERKSAMRKKK